MKILLKNLSGQAFSGFCSNSMCQSKVILDTDNFWNVKNGMEVLIHEYGHILDFLINQILNNQNQHFDSRKYLISSLANDTKITNEAYQKLLAYGVVRSSYGRSTSSSNWELFTEAFTRWIVTPKQNRDLGWEKLDKFFRIDLPAKL